MQKIKKAITAALLTLTLGVGAIGLTACDMGDNGGNGGTPGVPSFPVENESATVESSEETSSEEESSSAESSEETSSEEESSSAESNEEISSEEESSSVEECAHNYIIDEAVAATCEKDGLTAGTSCSECGHVLIAQETIPALGHDFTEYVSDNNATCAKNGTKTAVCNNGCGKIDTLEEENSMLSHEVSKTWSYDLEYHWHTSACACDEKHDYAEHTLDGYGTCTVCGNMVLPTDGIVYDVSADGTYMEVIDYTGTATDIVIADTVDGLPVKTICKETFKSNTSITSVLIPDGVTSIGSYAFSFCTSLTSVTIPDSVTSIGYRAFADCISLTSVAIGNSVTSIGWDAFADCDSLTSVTIPDSVTSIGSGAFAHCDSLQYNEYGNAKYLGNESNPYFALIETASDNISSCVIHEDTKIIADYAFSGCSRLTSVTIPDSVTSIGSYAFSGCSRLTSVTIGNGVTSIASYAFSSCSSLTSVTFEGTMEEWKAISKGSPWKYNVPATEVVCSDGTVTL